MFKRVFGALALLAAINFAAMAQTFNNRNAINFAASGDNTAIAAVSGQQIFIYGFDISLASATTVTLKCGTVALTGAMTMRAYSKGITASNAYWVCPANTAFVINLGGAVQTSGAVWFKQE